MYVRFRSWLYNWLSSCWVCGLTTCAPCSGSSVHSAKRFGTMLSSNTTLPRSAALALGRIANPATDAPHISVVTAITVVVSFMTFLFSSEEQARLDFAPRRRIWSTAEALEAGCFRAGPTLDLRPDGLAPGVAGPAEWQLCTRSIRAESRPIVTWATIRVFLRVKTDTTPIAIAALASVSLLPASCRRRHVRRRARSDHHA